MKKLYLVLIILAFAKGAIAQQTKNNSFSKRGGNVNGWFNPIDFIKNNATGPFTDTMSLVFPDSNTIYINKNNEVKKIYSHAWGHLFDLRHENWAAVPSNPNFPIQIFSSKDNYFWDSLAFSYIYRRNNSDTNVVDTCFVTYYKNSLPQQISNGLSIWSVGDTMLIARPRGLDTATLAGTAYFKRDTILLTANDTTTLTTNGWTSRYRVIPVGTAIMGSATAPTNNPPSWFAATIAFKPGHKWSIGDTIETRGIQQPKNGINYFGYPYTTIKEADGGLPRTLRSRNYADNSLLLTSDPSIVNWNGFLPTNTLASPNFNNVQAFVSGIIGSVAELGASLGNLYPNPAGSGQSIFIEYKLKKSLNISIEVYDMLGKKVATVLNNERVEAGTHQTETTLDLEAGIYFYTLSTGNTVISSKKFTVLR